MLRNLKKLWAALLLLTILSVPAKAELDFGFWAVYQNDYQRAFAELQPLAKSGDPRAQLWLGLMHYYGWGIPFNPRLAQDLIRKSANQLYKDGEFALCFIIHGCFTGGTPNN